MKNPNRIGLGDSCFPPAPREQRRDLATPPAFSAYDPAIWRAASDVITLHGRGAWQAAALQFMERDAAGDTAGAKVFLKIANAVASFEDLVARRAN